MNPEIHFFSEGISFTLKQKTKIRKWINSVIISEKQQAGGICFVFCTDDYLKKLNLSYLAHDTYTDILTFPDTGMLPLISGDVFISIPRVEENAVIYDQTFEQELYRVMIHGVLHLLGYNDHTKAEKKQMTLKEDLHLSSIA